MAAGLHDLAVSSDEVKRRAKLSRWSELGRQFERSERAEWISGDWDLVTYEAFLRLDNGRRGRIDVQLDLDDGSKVIIEVKRTDWGAMKEHRVRPNRRRHLRQVLKYVRYFADRGVDTHPALVYPAPPESFARRELIHAIANGEGVQVVWRPEPLNETRRFNKRFDG